MLTVFASPSVSPDRAGRRPSCQCVERGLREAGEADRGAGEDAGGEKARMVRAVRTGAAVGRGAPLRDRRCGDNSARVTGA